MRKFVYRLPSERLSGEFGEENVLSHKLHNMFIGCELFELVPRTVEVVSKMEIK